MSKILNLTQHKATSDQLAAGVVDLPDGSRAKLQELLTFDELPSVRQLRDRASSVTELAYDALYNKDDGELITDEVMIGGAPFFMSYLENYLRRKGLKPVYAFSRRVVEEQQQADGTTKKIAVFKHEGFVPA